MEVGLRTDTRIPIELPIVVPDQKYSAELLGVQHAELLQWASTRPKRCTANLEDLTSKVDTVENPIYKSFKMAIENKLVEVPALILSPPCIMYGSNVKLMQNNGIWNGRNEDNFVLPVEITEPVLRR